LVGEKSDYEALVAVEGSMTTELSRTTQGYKAGEKGWVSADVQVVDVCDGNAVIQPQSDDVYQYKSLNGQTCNISRHHLAVLNRGDSTLSAQDFTVILETCIYEKLNPVCDIVVFKKGDKPAQLIIKDACLLKRADAHKDYEGFLSGWIVGRQDGTRKYIDTCTDIEAGYSIIGAWSHVFRKGRKHSKVEALISQYSPKNPSEYSTWGRFKELMIAKISRVQAIRQSFPENIGGMYAESEMTHITEPQPAELDDKKETADSLSNEMADAMEANTPKEETEKEKEDKYYKANIALVNLEQVFLPDGELVDKKMFDSYKNPILHKTMDLDDPLKDKYILTELEL